jgi:hypothetical protein
VRWVAIASGPSLTPADCELVRQSGLPTVVVNTSFRLCPWASALYAHDVKWWMAYHEEVSRDFKGKRLGFGAIVTKFGAEAMHGKMATFGNSGADAISYAIKRGAKEVVMLGFDCRITTKTHWHGDHPKGMSNAKTIGMWPEKFKRLADFAKKQDVRVVNASRETGLRCFERVKLEDVL